MLAVSGATVMPVKVAAPVSVKTATGELVTAPMVAVMLVTPCATPVASPLEFIVAVAGTDEVHVATLVTSTGG